MVDEPTKDELLEQIETLAQEKMVVLFGAETDEGEPFYCYVQLTLEKFAEFTQAQEAGEEIDITTLGEVVERGWGENPPPEVEERMQREYGMDEAAE